jgi:hypothetical protein
MKNLEELLNNPVKLEALEQSAQVFYSGGTSIPKAWALATLEMLLENGFIVYKNQLKVVDNE